MKKFKLILVMFISLNLYLPLGLSQIFQPYIEKNAPVLTQQEPYQLFLPSVMSQPEAYYVSPDGNDMNPGTFLQPWRTIGKAARSVIPGDTVYVRAGTYYEFVRLSVSGREQNPINFLAYPGETPVVDGQNQIPGGWTGLITVIGDWVRISGFEVRNSLYVGVQLEGQHDRADHIYAHHNQLDGIFIQGDFGTVEDSRIWRNVMANQNNTSGIREPALATARDTVDDITDYAVLRNNIVWENWGIGIDTFESNGTVIAGNIVHDNIGNIKISDATNVVCNRNFIYMTPGSITYRLGSNYGILLGDERYTPPSANLTIINNIAYGNLKNMSWYRGVQGGGMNNVLIANNTFVNNMPNEINARNVDIGSGTHQNVRIMNNIIVQDDLQHIEDITINPEVVLSYNLWSNDPRDAILGTNSIVADPELARTGDPFTPAWFHLTASSPGLDNALLLPEVLVDFYRRARGSAPDRGAVEYFP
jgi:parallel beta-helix repeat protein